MKRNEISIDHIYVMLNDHIYYIIQMKLYYAKVLRIIKMQAGKTTNMQPADCKSSSKYFKICKWGFACNAKWTS